MIDNQLELIRQYCDTRGVRLSQSDKDWLCMILNNPERYDGFVTRVYEKETSGRDYRDTYVIVDKRQYRINVFPTLSIDGRYYHGCDGYIQDEHWSWDNPVHITDVRRIIDILREIGDEL